MPMFPFPLASTTDCQVMWGITDIHKETTVVHVFGHQILKDLGEKNKSLQLVIFVLSYWAYSIPVDHSLDGDHTSKKISVFISKQHYL